MGSNTFHLCEMHIIFDVIPCLKVITDTSNYCTPQANKIFLMDSYHLYRCWRYHTASPPHDTRNKPITIFIKCVAL